MPGGIEELARTLAIEPVPDRGRFVAELTRLVYDTEARNPTAAAFLAEARLKVRPPSDSGVPFDSLRRTDSFRRPDFREPDGARAYSRAHAGKFDLVPVPLTAEVWSNAIFHRKIPPDELVVTILADRQAALLCHGLASLDDETLQFFVEHSSLLTRLYERSAPAFAVFASNLRIRAGRVVPPAGDAAVPLWEAVVEEKVTRVDKFVLALFDSSEGRVAYLYDAIGQLDPARRAFVLGLWMTDPVVRVDRFKELATVGVSAFRDWHLRTTPYGRAPFDLGMMLVRVEVTAGGAPASPSSRAFWSRAFDGPDLPDEASPPPKLTDDQPVDAAWLAQTIGDSEVRQRAERLDQLAFAQRRFGSAVPGDAHAVLVAIRAMSHFRTLIFTLERIGVRTPSLFAAAARQASRLVSIDGSRGFAVQAQFQGALALVARMAAVRTLTRAQAESLIQRLVALPVTDGRFAGAVARWLQEDVAAVTAKGSDMESWLIAALSGGASSEAAGTYVTWEGQRYRLDLGYAERRRLQQVREKQESVPIDVPLDLASLARRLGGPTVTAADLDDAIARLSTLGRELPRRSRNDAGMSGVGSLDVHETIRRALEELRGIRANGVKRGARAGEPLAEAADELLAQSLVSFAYAMSIGDPGGTVLLAGDVSYRHDFGFGMKDNSIRTRAAWSLPRQEISPGVPWHVSGSLLALDVALAPLALRRMSSDHIMRAPKLTSNERDAFAATVALMNPFALRDVDRDAIVAAMARGRARVAALATDPSGFDSVAETAALDGWRRRTVRWTMLHDPDRLASLFPASELLFLGEPTTAALDDWGMIALTAGGCLCLRLPAPGQLWMLVGRPQLGIVATVMPDVTLHVAAMLKNLGLPAALTRVVLSAAMQDFVDEVRPTDDADWMTLARMATMATREQIEDYLAAATADGPLVPDNGRPSSPQ